MWRRPRPADAGFGQVASDVPLDHTRVGLVTSFDTTAGHGASLPAAAPPPPPHGDLALTSPAGRWAGAEPGALSTWLWVFCGHDTSQKLKLAC